MFEKLTPEMQSRLEKWRANTLQVKSVEKVLGRLPLKFRPVGRDHGDDLSDFEELHNKKLLEGKNER